VQTLPIGPPPPRPKPPGGPFNLLTRVGAGGFGEVYRAWDPNLQREIAVKLLLPGTVDSEAEFQTTLHEARALASVKHPNIVSIYGCERHNGRVGFWTDFIHGKTLASLLVTQGAFGYHEAALIGLEVTRALAAVHRANLLHRDIKPENVMREEGGRILLMDFGLSSLPQHTSQLAGTPNYMAPELFRRQPATICTDIYAVGVLLYFLVTGQTPARLNGLTTAQAAEACSQRKPLIDLRSDLPEAFLRIVNRAIALAPEDRFRSAGEMAEALASSLGASSSTYVAPPLEVPIPLSPREAKKQRKDEEKAQQQKHPLFRFTIPALVLFFIFGNRIPILRNLFGHHTPQSSSAATPDPDDASDNPDDTAAAGKTAAPDSSDLYDQGQALLLKSYKESNLTAAIAKFQQIPASAPSYPLALAGLGSAHFIQYRNSQDPRLLDQAIAETNRAIKLDPDAAPPYVTLARIATVQGKNPLATQMAEKAISLDHSSADAYRAQADVLEAEGRHPEAVIAMQKAADLAPEDWRFPMILGIDYAADGKLQAAADQFKKSAELAKDNAFAYYNLGHIEMELNQYDNAQKDIQRSLDIEPHDWTYEELSSLSLDLGKNDHAVNAAQHAILLAPESYLAWGALGEAFGRVSQDHNQSQDAYRKAVAFAEAARKKEPKNADTLARLSMFYARLGQSTQSLTLLRQAALLAPEDPTVNYLAAITYELLGNRRQAILSLSKCLKDGCQVAEIQRNPDLATLRTDPLYTALINSENQAQTSKN
jgi:serine/threonine protein kinase/Tfp pilus assembly protein PilF